MKFIDYKFIDWHSKFPYITIRLSYIILIIIRDKWYKYDYFLTLVVSLKNNDWFSSYSIIIKNHKY